MQDNRFAFARYEELRETVKREICSKCEDYSPGETGEQSYVCHSCNFAQGCAVMHFLPELILIARDAGEDGFEKFRGEVKNKLCPQCVYRAKPGECILLSKDDCVLDRNISQLFTILSMALKTSA